MVCLVVWLCVDGVCCVAGRLRGYGGRTETLTGWGRKDFKTEEERKFIKAGSATDTMCTSSLCGLSLDRPLPVGRVLAWLSAWRWVNGDLRKKNKKEKKKQQNQRCKKTQTKQRGRKQKTQEI